jgi:hypothetical protein
MTNRTRVSEVLLADGWHMVAAKSFKLLDADDGLLFAGLWGQRDVGYGFTFEEYLGADYANARITGPLTSVLAVRESLR